MHKTLNIQTKKKKQVVDITNDVEKILPEGEGICNIFLKHTSAALSTADLDPGTDEDMLDAFENMIPKLNYRHPHDPSHVGDHILSAMIGGCVSIPYSEGHLHLGTWQRVVIFEFNGPRERSVTVSFLEGGN